MENVLVIDIGGTHIKVASSDQRVPLKIPSGPTMTGQQMAQQVKSLVNQMQANANSQATAQQMRQRPTRDA